MTDDDHADENFGDTERSADAFDCSHQKFRKQRHDAGRDHEDQDGFGPAPMLDLFLQLAFASDEEMLVRAEGKHEHAEIRDEEHNRDA